MAHFALPLTCPLNFPSIRIPHPSPCFRTVTLPPLYPDPTSPCFFFPVLFCPWLCLPFPAKGMVVSVYGESGWKYWPRAIFALVSPEIVQEHLPRMFDFLKCSLTADSRRGGETQRSCPQWCFLYCQVSPFPLHYLPFALDIVCAWYVSWSTSSSSRVCIMMLFPFQGFQSRL